jgi:transcriptional regulator with XRE-family HTH domain
LQTIDGSETPGAHDVDMSVRRSSERSEASVALGRAVRAIREERGISQVQLAEATGLEQSWISHVERGARNPTWQNVVRLAKGLGVGIGELAARTEGSRDTGDTSDPS